MAEENVREEIETLRAVYNEDELFIDDETAGEGHINISYTAELDKYCRIKIQFNIQKHTTISVLNDESSTKLIPSNTLKQIEQILIDKYNKEGEYMPIFQCISFCHDDLLTDKTLNLSDQLNELLLVKPKHTLNGLENEEMTYAKQKNINKKDYFNRNKSEYKNNPLKDFQSYWSEMNEYKKEYESQTIKTVSKSDKINPDKNKKQKKENDGDEKSDDGTMGTWARYSLKQIDIRLWNATPTTKQIRKMFEKSYKNHHEFKYSITFIAKHHIIQKFLNNAEYGPFTCKYDIVYKKCYSYQEQKIIDNGFDIEPDYGINCYRDISKFDRLYDAHIFLCMIRTKNCVKNEDNYMVTNDADIVPIYLLKFDAQPKSL